MHAEYLIFNAIVIAGPLGLSFWKRCHFRERFGPAWLSIALAAIPFLVWDAIVSGSHWDFNPAYTLPFRIAGLPLGEILFFFAVPFSCLFTWQHVVRPEQGKKLAAEWLYWPIFALVPAGVWVFSTGLEYTGLVLGALGIAAAVDRLAGTKLLLKPRFWLFQAIVFGFTFVFNGYLTGRPIVTYGEEFQVGIRLWTTPLEDFGYGAALLWIATTFYEFFKPKRAEQTVAEGLIERRFGGYEHVYVEADDSEPERLEDPASAPRVAVVGGGIAGLTSAITLARRGFRVELFEAAPYLGGKIGAWKTTLPDGRSEWVEHGFHAFFPQYYNLNRFLDTMDLREDFRPVDDYLILTHERRYSFSGLKTAPLLNMVSMLKKGFFRIGEMAKNPESSRMQALLQYDAEHTFEDYDEVSFQAFADAAGLPQELRLIFNSFSRAFFSEPERMSMAELIKSFHFYFLSNDGGLLYDMPSADYDTALLTPMRIELEAHDGRVHLETPVESIERRGEGFSVNGEPFDKVILTTDVAGTKKIAERSEALLSEAPDFRRKLVAVEPSQRYAVWRVWLDRSIAHDFPGFFVCDKVDVLDSITFYRKVQDNLAAWEDETGGMVVELHSYSIPDHITDDAEVKRKLWAEFVHYIPELAQAEIVHDYFQHNQNFTAFHLGLHKQRPEVQTPIDGLLLAGDWVKLPIPAMLMEAACSSALMACNVVLRQHGLREERLTTVPLRGLGAGLRRPPKPIEPVAGKDKGVSEEPRPAVPA